MKQHPIYTVDYFIEKFEKIPDHKWKTGWGNIDKGAATCATGHCGFDNINHLVATEENLALKGVLSIIEITVDGNKEIESDGRFSWKAVRINDGVCDQYKQPTPKQRILAALYDIKALIEPKKAEHKPVPHPSELTKEYVQERLDVITEKITTV